MDETEVAPAPVTSRVTGVKDVAAHDFIKAFAAHLKQTNKVQLPAYVDYIKTAAFKELNPLDDDWYYVRAAAVARRIYNRKGLGVGGLRRAFGGRTHKAGKASPEHHAKGAGGIIRHCFQQLEALGLVEKASDGGRVITSEGQRQMDLVASSVEVTRFHYLG